MGDEVMSALEDAGIVGGDDDDGTDGSFGVILGLARAVASAERAVREFVRGQVAA